MPVAPVLIIAWGNPSRGDDALGPAVYERLEQDELSNVEAVTDFQLQIEHCTDIANRAMVVFVDASFSAQEPYELSRVYPEKDNSFTSHALSPQSLLSICQQVNDSPLPESYLLAIRGYDFALGDCISRKARGNLDLAYRKLQKILTLK